MLDFAYISKKFFEKDGNWLYNTIGGRSMPRKKLKIRETLYDDHFIDEKGLDGPYWSYTDSSVSDLNQ